jgi:hypothetical protein
VLLVPPAPLPDADYHEQNTEQDLRPPHPGGLRAVTSDAASQRCEQRYGDDDPGDPTDQEPGARGGRVRGKEHEDGGDDRYG